MSRGAIPEEVVAAIAAAISLSVGVPAERLRLRLSGPAPADDNRGAWQLAGQLNLMHRRSRDR